MQHCFLLSWKSQRFLGSAMGIAIADRKNRCDFGALSTLVSGKDSGCILGCILRKLANSWSTPRQLPTPREVAGVFLAVVLWQHPKLAKLFFVDVMFLWMTVQDPEREFQKSAGGGAGITYVGKMGVLAGVLAPPFFPAFLPALCRSSHSEVLCQVARISSLGCPSTVQPVFPLLVFHFNYSDPPTLAFLKQARETTQQKKVSPSAEPLKSLGRNGKTHRRGRRIGKQKKARKSKKARIGGSGSVSNRTVLGPPPRPYSERL